MTEHREQESIRIDVNGHKGPHTLEEITETLANYGNPRQFTDMLIDHLRREPYPAELVYEPAFLKRCAELKRDHRPLYKGRLWAAMKQTPGVDAWEWDQEIDVLVYATDRLPTVPLSSIDPQEVDWLWEPYIPFKKITLVEGDPEAGKTFLLLAITAAVTRGFCLPDEEGQVAGPHGNVGNVLYLTAEDGLADTIRKRAEQCQADLDRIFVVPTADMFPEEMQAFSLARPHLLRAAIEERAARLVILDPLTAFLGGEMDMHRANEVRPVMSTLVAMATQCNCAIVCIRHWTKMTGGKARYRGQGNIDFTASARSVLSVGESPEDERLRIMAQSKNSISRRGTSIVFQITSEGFQWAGTSLLSADELSAAQPTRHHEQRKDSMKWLKDYLKDGPQMAEMILHAAEAVGLSERTLRRAKEHLHILSTKDNGIWYWRLPTFQKWDRYPGQEEDGTF